MVFKLDSRGHSTEHISRGCPVGREDGYTSGQEQEVGLQAPHLCLKHSSSALQIC